MPVAETIMAAAAAIQALSAIYSALGRGRTQPQAPTPVSTGIPPATIPKPPEFYGEIPERTTPPLSQQLMGLTPQMPALGRTQPSPYYLEDLTRRLGGFFR